MTLVWKSPLLALTTLTSVMDLVVRTQDRREGRDSFRDGRRHSFIRPAQI